MYKNEKYIGNLIITEKKVSIDTNKSFLYLYIQFKDDLKINSLLADDFDLVVNNKKIIINNKTNTDTNNVYELFNYYGMAKITKCTMLDIDRDIYDLNIVNQDVILWHNWGVKKHSGDDGGTWDKQTGSLQQNWKNLSFNGKNNRFNK